MLHQIIIFGAGHDGVDALEYRCYLQLDDMGIVNPAFIEINAIIKQQEW